MIAVFFKASLPMERALVAFIAKVEGVVIENFYPIRFSITF